MRIFTQQEIDNALEKIKTLSHYEMCGMWRFTSIEDESIYFVNTTPVAEAFKERLFIHFGGFTSEISKSLGLNKTKQ